MKLHAFTVVITGWGGDRDEAWGEAVETTFLSHMDTPKESEIIDEMSDSDSYQPLDKPDPDEL